MNPPKKRNYYGAYGYVGGYSASELPQGTLGCSTAVPLSFETSETCTYSKIYLASTLRALNPKQKGTCKTTYILDSQIKYLIANLLKAL